MYSIRKRKEHNAFHVLDVTLSGRQQGHSSARRFGDSRRPQETGREDGLCIVGKTARAHWSKWDLAASEMKDRCMPLAMVQVPSVFYHVQNEWKGLLISRGRGSTRRLSRIGRTRDTSRAPASKKGSKTYLYIFKFREYIVEVMHELHEMFCDLMSSMRQPTCGLLIGAIESRAHQ